jgi:hypothetical protein
VPLYFGRTKSQFRSGYNGSEGPIIVQKEKKILGLLNPGLNIFPIFEKVLQGILFEGELDFILARNTMDARPIDRFLSNLVSLRHPRLSERSWLEELRNAYWIGPTCFPFGLKKRAFLLRPGWL